MKILRFLYVLLFVTLASCEKVILDEEESENEPASVEVEGNVVLRIEQLGQMSFQAMVKDADEEVPAHLCFAIYDMGGTRVKQTNQKQGDKNYGIVGMQLDEGEYQLVLLAHNSTKNPTMTNLSKIQFNNTIGYTDTYLYYTTLSVTEEQQTVTASLDRIVALCRFVISDPIPESVTQMKFQYKGGSGHFSALTGFGVTNSTQIVTRQVQPGQQYQVFDLYTFLHQEEGNITLTAIALDAAGNSLSERNFKIPMAQNQVTWLTGNFFADKDDPDQWRLTPNIPLDKRWGNEVFYTY